MNQITITRPVIIKAIVSDSYKKGLAAEVGERLSVLERRLEYLDFQYNRIIELENNKSQLSRGDLINIDDERQKLRDTVSQLTGKLKDIAALGDGQEVVHGRVESIIELRVGDDWAEIMSAEVVVKDGKVIEIRQGVFL
ncbi:MAG: hypothetical protein HGA27_01195 [Peptococcaceae bacterium]|nr:hypothetical protein [Peptococcaceae bacterium]